MQGEWEKHYGSRWVKMFVRDENAFVSLGSNCLPEVQLIKNFGDWKGVSPDPEKSGYSHMPSLFDTGGVTPDALIEILNIIKCGGNPAIILGDISTYEGEVQKEGTVVHLIVDKLMDRSRWLSLLTADPHPVQLPILAAMQQSYS